MTSVTIPCVLAPLLIKIVQKQIEHKHYGATTAYWITRIAPKWPTCSWSVQCRHTNGPCFRYKWPTCAWSVHGGYSENPCPRYKWPKPVHCGNTNGSCSDTSGKHLHSLCTVDTLKGHIPGTQSGTVWELLRLSTTPRIVWFSILGCRDTGKLN